jgi:uncharacterized membrane protein
MSATGPAYRVDGEALRKDVPVLLLIALDVAFGLAAWGRMPARVPIHWGTSGQPNGWGPAWVNAFVPPAIAIFLYATFLYIPLIDPHHRNYASFAGPLRALRLLVVGFLAVVHVLVVLASLGVDVPMDGAMRAGLPLLFAGLGTLLPRLKPNWFFGIRTPWTLASEEVWTKTHALGGRLWTLGGLALAACAFLPAVAGLAALVGGIVVLVLVPVVWSAVLYRRLAAPR